MLVGERMCWGVYGCYLLIASLVAEVIVLTAATEGHFSKPYLKKGKKN